MFREIEERINERPQIRVKGLLKRRREKSVEHFLPVFFGRYNVELDTIYTENGEIQTIANRRRSLGDIYQICKYYYPNLTILELLRLLYNEEYLRENNIGTSFCYTINKRVWYHSERPLIFNTDVEDEYGRTWANWISLIK